LTSFINPGIWLIFPAYNVIVAILSPQNYHPMLAIRGCIIIMPGNFSAFSWHYYIISILKKQVERTYLQIKPPPARFPSLLSPFSYIIIIATTIDVINTADTAAITYSQKNPTCIFLIS